MSCPKCKKDSPLLALHCMHCGLNFKAASAQSKHRHEEKIVQDTRRAESMSKLSEIQSKQLKNACIAGGIAFVTAIVGWFLVNIWVIFGAMFIGAMICYKLTRFTSDNYYSIPHSRDASFNHRCIYCGHKGIYTQGEYKTNNTHSNCTKCKEHLFSD